jgi:hypothetical protein
LPVVTVIRVLGIRSASASRTNCSPIVPSSIDGVRTGRKWMVHSVVGIRDCDHEVVDAEQHPRSLAWSRAGRMPA